MDYKDFQILSDDEYNTINTHMSESKTFDRPTATHQIFIELLFCQNAEFNQIKKFNGKVTRTLNNSKTILNKTVDNFQSLFNYNEFNKHIHSISIFDYISKLISLNEKLIKWSIVEKKEYYKSFAQKTSFEILNLAKEIVEAINMSNIYFFKFM